MNQGKSICNQLKEIRKEIARENDIPLDSKECTYDGPCNGTCPHCEAELKYIEDQLTKRSQLGKAAVVAGMTLGMVTAAQDLNAQNDNRHEKLMGDVVAESRIDTTSINGYVFDGDNGKKIISAHITVIRKDDSIQCAETTSDTNGFYNLQLPYGEYLVDFHCVGYLPRMVTLDVTRKNMEIIPIEMRRMEEMLMGIVPYYPDKEQDNNEEEEKPQEQSN